MVELVFALKSNEFIYYTHECNNSLDKERFPLHSHEMARSSSNKKPLVMNGKEIQKQSGAKKIPARRCVVIVFFCEKSRLALRQAMSYGDEISNTAITIIFFNRVDEEKTRKLGN